MEYFNHTVFLNALDYMYCNTIQNTIQYDYKILKGSLHLQGASKYATGYGPPIGLYLLGDIVGRSTLASRFGMGVQIHWDTRSQWQKGLIDDVSNEFSMTNLIPKFTFHFEIVISYKKF